MNEIAREKLREIVARGGDEVLQDRNRCEGLMKDHCGSCRLEISVLMGALEERVPLELSSSWQSAMTPEAMRARLVQRLHEHRGLTPEVADWAVEAWSYALGVDLRRISDPINQSLKGENAEWVGNESVVGTDGKADGESRLKDDAPTAGEQIGPSQKNKSLSLASVGEWNRPKKGIAVGGVLAVLLLLAYASGNLNIGPIKGDTIDDPKQLEEGLETTEQVLAAAARSGATVRIRINEGVDSEHGSVGQEISAMLAEPLVVDGQEIIPAGSPAVVRVTGVKNAGHFKGVSEIGVTLAQVSIDGRSFPVSSRPYLVRGKSRGKDTAIKTGVGAAGGGVIGGLLGKGKGALIGAAAGTSGALGLQAATKPSPAVIQAEDVISFRLTVSPALKR